MAVDVDRLAAALERQADALGEVVGLARALAVAEARAARAECERDALLRRLADRGDAARELEHERADERRRARTPWWRRGRR